jgi:hypothetical protein
MSYHEYIFSGGFPPLRRCESSVEDKDKNKDKENKDILFYDTNLFKRANVYEMVRRPNYNFSRSSNSNNELRISR